MTHQRGSINNYHHMHNDIQVEQSSKDRLQKDEEFGLPSRGFNLLTLSYRAAFALLQSIRATDSLKTPQKVLDAIKDFLTALKKLELSDVSDDWRYCEKLSRSWNAILQSIDGLNLDSIALNEFLEMVLDHPEKGDHTLGYYLSQHAGEEWIPFPFMEILRRLHENRDTLQKIHKQGELTIRSLS